MNPSATFSSSASKNLSLNATADARFVEQQSKDPVVRHWAAKAVQALDNDELSIQGRVRIVRDIQERITARLDELAGKRRTQPANATRTPSAALGCPKQMARLRESFKQQTAAPVAAAPSPAKKIVLPPRKARPA